MNNKSILEYKWARIMLAAANTLFSFAYGFLVFLAAVFASISGNDLNGWGGLLILFGVLLVLLVSIVAGWLVAFKKPHTASLFMCVMACLSLGSFLLWSSIGVIVELFK